VSLNGPDHILIYGSGLAAVMSAAALRAKLPESVKITWLESNEDGPQSKNDIFPKSDMFYGSVSDPSCYDLHRNPIEPYIMPAAAAYKGVFAHPPEGRKIPLASAEYGYQFSPASLVTLMRAKLKTLGVTHIISGITAWPAAPYADGS